MKKQDKLIVTLPEMNIDGKFDCKIGKDHLFINRGIQNEQVEVEITKKIKEGYVGEIRKIIKPSAFRVPNDCPYQDCGGCDLREMLYDKQCDWKKHQLHQLYHAMGIKVKEFIGMEYPYAYRNKAIMTFQKVQKQVNFGFYQENSHIVRPIKKCLNHDDTTNQIFKSIESLVKKFHIEIFDEDTQKGLMRHVLIRRAIKTNQTLVCLVVGKKEFKGSNNFVKELLKLHPEITTVVLNINPRRTSVVLGNEEKVLFGKGFIVDELLGNTYRISAASFYQINHKQTEILYQKAIDQLNLTGNEQVLDMYCGIGTIGMSLARKVKQVIGVEINASAVKDANNNAKMNQLTNTSFVCKDASEYMMNAASKKQKVDVLIMDPPRSGSDETFIRNAVAMRPRQILYISCNPVTQKRDLVTFKQFGYETKEVIGVDLFPMSAHIESIVCLRYQKGNK